jgi:hypothetical protein
MHVRLYEKRNLKERFQISLRCDHVVASPPILRRNRARWSHFVKWNYFVLCAPFIHDSRYITHFREVLAKNVWNCAKVTKSHHQLFAAHNYRLDDDRRRRRANCATVSSFSSLDWFESKHYIYAAFNFFYCTTTKNVHQIKTSEKWPNILVRHDFCYYIWQKSKIFNIFNKTTNFTQKPSYMEITHCRKD